MYREKAGLEMKKRFLPEEYWNQKYFNYGYTAYHAEEERVYLLLEDDDSLADVYLMQSMNVG